jgi:6-phospho-beta-glucosidase
MERIARTTMRLAPRAWVLNFTNPAGLVTEALLPTLGDRVVGICDSPTALCARVARAIGRPTDELAFGYTGLNHLGWLLSVSDGTGDVLPRLLADDQRLMEIDEARLFGADRLRRDGMIPNEYLVYYRSAPAITETFRREASRGQVLMDQQRSFYEATWRTPAEALALWRRTRDLRHATYMAEAWRDAGRPTPAPPVARPGGPRSPDRDEDPGDAGYAAIAAWFVLAVAGARARTLILDTANGGRVPWLPDDAVIEAPAEADGAGVRSRPVHPLPARQRRMVERVKEVERITIRAARERSARLAVDALAAHPLVPSRDVAERIWTGYTAGHAALRAFR